MLKSIIVCALAGLGATSAHASPFTLDMWIYEFSISGEPQIRRAHARTLAPAGTPVPDGCYSLPASNGDIEIECSGVSSFRPGVATEDLGIDVDATIEPQDLARFEDTVRIGFNSTHFACTGSIFYGCPEAGSTDWYPRVSGLDYGTGSAVLQYPVFQVDTVSFHMSFHGAFATGAAVSRTSGFWDYGYGGTWWDSDPDPLWYYGGAGVLIQQPAAVPLPASGLMLLSALGLFLARLRHLGKRRTGRVAARGTPSALVG